MKAIEVKNLSFQYRDSGEPALKGINFSQDQGQFVALVGLTGAGKSTLCCCLNGLIPNFIKGNFQGNIKILGEDIAGRRVHDLAQKVGLIFQDFEAQLFSTNVELEVVFGPENFCLSAEEMDKRLKDSLSLLGLTGFEKRDPSTLSGGEKQRLAIASVLALKPQILVLDEPTTDLDPQSKRAIFSIVKKLREEKSTVFMVEHETEELTDADEIAIMNNGEIVAQGSPFHILRQLQLLDDHGVQPRQIDLLLASVNIENEASTAEEAAEILQKAGWSLNSTKLASLKTEDQDRKRNYQETLISVDNLTHSYDGTTRALDGVSLEIRRGEFLAILGQNGCGKTTLVKHFNRLLIPSSGKVVAFGRDTANWKMSQLGKRVGYVFQNPDHQIFANTVGEEVSFGPKNFGLSERDVINRMEQALKDVGLQGYEDEDPFSLTKGERQRVAIASILASQPEVIILDEPTTGLDYRGQRAVMELLKKLNLQGHTIIVITHCMWAAAEYCHRCIVMSNGKIVRDGDTRDIFADDSTLAAASLRAPEIVRLGKLMGGSVLSVQEMQHCLQK